MTVVIQSDICSMITSILMILFQGSYLMPNVDFMWLNSNDNYSDILVMVLELCYIVC